ncbi:hypothetical protein KIN20_012944 [Parelaphostrongylus tenuis]|uniref:Uncharacterized protein n=1 Tax=Parelaphostrongylus tenuis TaxID=148309 RepID=A0AAD5MXI7_PARTN|nr:hypothetical protein KIN20_012944 [Parelaphostrongylus tenuis]
MIDKLTNPKDLTQERLWKSHVIANTRKGLFRTASQLVSEADLPDVPASRAATTPARLPPMPRMRSLILPALQPRSLVLPGASGLTTASTNADIPTPISSHNKRIGSGGTQCSQGDQSFLEPSPGRVRKSKSSTGFPQKLQLRSSASGGTRLPIGDRNTTHPYKDLNDIVNGVFQSATLKMLTSSDHVSSIFSVLSSSMS